MTEVLGNAGAIRNGQGRTHGQRIGRTLGGSRPLSGPHTPPTEERSLGDMLGEALRRDPSQPEPWDVRRMLLGDLADVLAPKVEEEPDPFLTATDAVARAAAETLNVPHEDALMALCTIPDNMMTLLDSPEGWSALVEYIAQQLQVPSAPYRPSIQ